MKIIQATSIMKWLGNALVLMFVLTLINCGDDAPTMQVTIEDKMINLKDAKLYLVYESSYDDYTYRDYFISDGVPNGNTPWSLSDYDNATFLIAIQLATKSVSGLSAGTYPTINDWSTATGEKIGDLYYQVAVEGSSPVEYINPDTGPNIAVKGKFDGEDTITLSFNGSMVNYDTQELVPAILYFNGEIIDTR